MTTPLPRKRHNYPAHRRSKITPERIAEFDHLTRDTRISVTEAALRAGWPTLGAAYAALHRAGHPLAPRLAAPARRAG